MYRHQYTRRPIVIVVIDSIRNACAAHQRAKQRRIIKRAIHTAGTKSKIELINTIFYYFTVDFCVFFSIAHIHTHTYTKARVQCRLSVLVSHVERRAHRTHLLELSPNKKNVHIAYYLASNER